MKLCRIHILIISLMYICSVPLVPAQDPSQICCTNETTNTEPPIALSFVQNKLFQGDSPNVFPPVEFGSVVSMDGEWLAIGAPSGVREADILCEQQHLSLKSCRDSGVVHMWRRVAGHWQFHELVEPMFAINPRGRFGHSIALDGDVMLIGEPHTDACVFSLGGWHNCFRESIGNVYVYFLVVTKIGTEEETFSWQFWRTLEQPSTLQPGSQFGYSVALSAGLAVVGAPYFQEIDPITSEHLSPGTVLFYRLGVPSEVPVAMITGSNPHGNLGKTVATKWYSALNKSISVLGEPGYISECPVRPCLPDGRIRIYLEFDLVYDSDGVDKVDVLTAAGLGASVSMSVSASAIRVAVGAPLFGNCLPGDVIRSDELAAITDEYCQAYSGAVVTYCVQAGPNGSLQTVRRDFLISPGADSHRTATKLRSGESVWFHNDMLAISSDIKWPCGVQLGDQAPVYIFNSFWNTPRVDAGDCRGAVILYAYDSVGDELPRERLVFLPPQVGRDVSPEGAQTQAARWGAIMDEQTLLAHSVSHQNDVFYSDELVLFSLQGLLSGRWTDVKVLFGVGGSTSLIQSEAALSSFTSSPPRTTTVYSSAEASETTVAIKNNTMESRSRVNEDLVAIAGGAAALCLLLMLCCVVALLLWRRRRRPSVRLERAESLTTMHHLARHSSHQHQRASASETHRHASRSHSRTELVQRPLRVRTSSSNASRAGRPRRRSSAGRSASLSNSNPNYARLRLASRRCARCAIPVESGHTVCTTCGGSPNPYEVFKHIRRESPHHYDLAPSDDLEKADGEPSAHLLTSSNEYGVPMSLDGSFGAGTSVEYARLHLASSDNASVAVLGSPYADVTDVQLGDSISE